MFKEAIVKQDQKETAIALLEDGQLMEMYFEKDDNTNSVGNIYKGKVENILPGMQAAFVNIGQEKNAFLYVNEAVKRNLDLDGNILDTEEKIENVLYIGQEILVQVMKEPVGNKGARITTHISLPGRFCVLMPTVDYIGISRKIEDESRREELKAIAKSSLEKGMGAIIRTAADQGTPEDIISDIHQLTKKWKRIQGKFLESPAKSCVNSELGLQERLVRDILPADIDKVIVNTAELKQNLDQVADDVLPELSNITEVYRGDIFAAYDVSNQLVKSLRRKVWLNCGGYLIIDKTEALTVIDVNTGKFIGENNLEDTVLQTNIEAACEIARQLRLRNIGGIIIIDFIDMKESENQDVVIDMFKEELKKDRVKTNILGFTGLGLLEMTRKKKGHELNDLLQKNCPYCGGKGKVLSEENIYMQIREEIYQVAGETEAKSIYIEASPSLVAYLVGPAGASLEDIKKSTGKNIIIKSQEGLAFEDVLVRPSYEEAESGVIAPVKVGEKIEVVIEEKHFSNETEGIGRIDGFVILIDGGGHHVGKKVNVEITRVGKTFANGYII